MTVKEAPQVAPEESIDKQEKFNQWSQKELVKIQKFCFSKGIQIKDFKKEKCLSMPPLVGIWYIISKTKGEDYWVISGELPTDIAPVKVAKDERDVTRYFSMSWHLKAARIEEAIAEGKQMGDKETQEKVVKELIEKAEALSQIHRDENLWKNSGLSI
ncbi:DUF4826 family protein [Aliikangiella sp. IMCC44359]|uniref:DUF4826 family protein n=1 Tax=Aliikangiella sp. IMCC44359 TaxID=3459125 RepID=UPI00403AB65E